MAPARSVTVHVAHARLDAPENITAPVIEAPIQITCFCSSIPVGVFVAFAGLDILNNFIHIVADLNNVIYIVAEYIFIGQCYCECLMILVFIRDFIFIYDPIVRVNFRLIFLGFQSFHLN